MKKRFYYILCVAFLTVFSVKALGQAVTVNAVMDSLQIFIGQQTQIRLQVFADAGQKIVLPLLKDTLTQGVEIIDRPTVDTVFINDGKRIQLTQTYTITSFDSALYYIPPFRVLVSNKPYYSKPLALKVYSLPVDEAHPEKFFPLRDVMKPSFAWEDWSGLIGLSVLLILISLLAGYLIVRLRDNKPIIRILKQTPKLPPHQQALEEIERIKHDKPWERDQEKEYYTQLTDALRNYIKDRFGFNATEMTSSEIIERLMKEAENKEVFNELKSLFQTADLVKFAKWKPEMSENDYNLVCAVEFINETKQPVSQIAPAVPVEVLMEEKRSKRTKIILFSVISTLTAGSIALIIYIFVELFKLLI